MIGYSKGRSFSTLAGSIGIGVGAVMTAMSIIDSGYGLIVHGIVVFILGVAGFFVGRTREKRAK